MVRSLYAHAHSMQMISLHRDPGGEKIFSKTSPTSDLSHPSLSNKEALKEKEQLIESLQNRVKELESSLQHDGMLDSGGEYAGDRKLSASKVTFSEVNTLMFKNDQHHTSSVSSSSTSIVDQSQA